jgi:hypothetical protein
MRREEAIVIAMEVSCYISQIFELWVVAGSYSLKEGFGDY